MNRRWRGVFLLFSVNTWAVVSVLSISLASALLILYRFSVRVSIKKASFFASIALIIVGLFAIFLGVTQAGYFDKHHEAIVFSRTVHVRSEPRSSSKTLFIIHSGTKVQLLEEEDRWIKIGLANGNEGWIAARDVKEI